MGDYLGSIFELDYPHYQIIFVVESDTDSAAAEIARFQERYPNIQSECVIAGRSRDCGQKVHNLLAAIAAAGSDAEAFAFVDSDVCLRKDWLRSLVAPLEDPQVGATTGYRWFIPTGGGFASLLRSAWNASIATTLGGHRNNFAWGGSMAILRRTFERIDMPGYWKGTVSDDFALTRAVKAAGLYVKFVPACLVPSFGSCTMRELLEFTSRQIIITRVYSGGLWRLLLISNIFFNLIFSLGIFLSVYSLLTGHGFWPMVITASIYLLSVWKGYLRVEAIKLILVEYDREILQHRWGYYLLAPVVAIVFLHNLFVSVSTNRITWRGITYELRSVNETAIAREG
jgi:ceramide glucosyltransferase